MKENLPLTRRFPRLTHFADVIFRNDGNGLTVISASVWFLVGLAVFILTNYNLFAKIIAATVIFGFLFILVLFPFFMVLCLFRSDDC